MNQSSTFFFGGGGNELRSYILIHEVSMAGREADRFGVVRIECGGVEDLVSCAGESGDEF